MQKWQLAQRQSLDLEVKVALTEKRIREWYEYWDGQVYVSFSGGKDSTVMLHIARDLYPDIEAVFCDTGLEFPEIRDFVKQTEGVTWLKPKILAIAGPKRTMPKNPITTDGIPARISIIGFTISRTFQWATSERYAATPIPIGIAIKSDPKVTIRVLAIIETMPYFSCTGEVGFQSLLVKNSLTSISRKAGIAV